MKTQQETIGALIQSIVKKRIARNNIKPQTKKRFGKKGTTLVESGRLLRSIKYDVKDGKIYIGSNLDYAQIQHEGGIITPSKAKFLAIPLTVQARARNPRQFKNTFVKFYFDEGKPYGIIFGPDNNGEMIPQYKLVKRVKIPARPYLFLNKEDKIRITNICLDHMALKLKELNQNWRDREK